MDMDAFERICGFDEGQKTKVLGGKTKAALFDAGLLDCEDCFKPLKDIDLSGIMIPDAAAMNHSIVGDYVLPSKDSLRARLKGGGHTDKAMEKMDKHGIAYNVVRTGSNGVIYGNVPDHKEKFKQTGEKQTWFPKSWTEYDIYAAGIFAANRGTYVNGYAKEAKYKGINIRIVFTDGRIGTICPSNDQNS